MKYWFLRLCLACIPLGASAQWNYPSYDALKGQIQSISSNKLVEQASIGKSFSGEQIPVLKIQSSKEAKPTLLIVAGVDGKHLAGSINALSVAKHILALPAAELQTLLSDKSIWIVPVLNVDAYKRNVQSLDWASGNGRQIDNDRDGRIDENPNVDLNKDGVISQMRIKLPAGPFRSHAEHPDLMVVADRTKSETGSYELFKEGLDTDQDGLFGEDGLGGVNIDRNFTFEYPFFEHETGDYAASEPETRAIIDLIFEHPQIATVLHFGLQNNLSVPEQFDPRKAGERITKSWTSNDTQISAIISQLYNKDMKSLGDAPKMPAGRGNFSSTVYYHTGKFSFVTPSWWIPSQADTSKKAPPNQGLKDEDRFANWVRAKQIQGAILPWTKIDHPDFPGQEVEVGGVVDKFRQNPPIEHLEESGRLHADFIIKLTKAMAKLEFSAPKVSNLGDDVYRIEIRLFNTGAMPVYPEIADRIKHVSKMKSILEIQKSQKFLSGKRLQLYPTLAAGGSTNFSWLVKGKGKVQLTVGCPSAGEKTIDITL